MVKLKPGRRKLPPRRMILYLLIALVLILLLLFWNRFMDYTFTLPDR
jgi:hypothetical protein